MLKHTLQGLLGHLGDIKFLLKHVKEVLIHISFFTLFLGLLENTRSSSTGQRLLNTRLLLLLDNFDILR